jgi:octaprenyl-diphosphate synthase
MSHGSSADRQLIRTAIEQGGEVEFDQVVAAIRRSGSLDYARQMALNEAELALSAARTMLQHAESGEFSAVVMSLPGLAVERAN